MVFCLELLPHIGIKRIEMKIEESEKAGSRLRNQTNPGDLASTH